MDARRRGSHRLGPLPGSDLFVVFDTVYHLGAEGEALFDPRREVFLRDRIAIAKLTYLILL